MKKIIHLTDLHFGKEGKHNVDASFRKIVNNICAQYPGKKNAKTGKIENKFVIIITGDLVDSLDKNGVGKEFNKVRDQIRKFEKHGFKVLVVPGNHDYGAGARQLEKWVDVFKLKFFGRRDIFYPKLDMIEGVAFIGLDTMEAAVKGNSILSDGKLGKCQLRDLKRMLTFDKNVIRAKKRVLYMHHRAFPYITGGPAHMLNDWDELRDVIKAKRGEKSMIDCMLFGHKHKAKKWNKWGIERIYDGGTSTWYRGNISPHHIIDLSKDPSTDLDGKFLSP